MIVSRKNPKHHLTRLSRSASLLCGVAMSALAAAPARADDGSLRILTLNIWDQFKKNPEVVADFMTKGNFDVIAFQEANNSTFVTGLPSILKNAGLGTYTYDETLLGKDKGVFNDLGIISRLPGTFGNYKLPGISGQGQYVNYTIAGEDNGRPQTLIGTVHLDPGDKADKRVNEAKALNNWAKSSAMPIILTGDFNAGDVSERGLHSVSQQEWFLRKYTESANNSFYYDLLRQYAKDDAALDKFISDWKGKGAAAINAAPIPAGLFADETDAVAGNTPQTMNVLKKQFMLLQTKADRELFAPHELNDGRSTWNSAFFDKNSWASWHRVKIDHFMAARPFGKWYAIDDKAGDAYAGVIDGTIVTKPDGTKTGISDHEPVSHTFKWVGPALETYTVDKTNKTRLVWGAAAPVFGEKGKEFYLTRNNMRTDVYLGQISDENGKPILAGLSDAEKKTLLDCKSTDTRFQQAIAEYCIDDHSFIGETLVKDGGTVIVDEDAALGSSSANLRLDNATLRVAGTAMGRLDRSVILEAGGGALDIADANNAVAIDRAISGTGSLTKLGQGALGLFGENSYTGETNVRAGRLVVDGSIAKSSLTTIFDSGILEGTGTVGNLKIGSGGTIAPGNGIGTLNVSGNLSFAKGSAYQVDVNTEGKSDLIAVTGKTAIEGGTVMSIAANGAYKPSTSYTILNSAGGIDGRFDGVTSNFAFLDPTLAYGATDIKLSLDRNDTAFNDVAITFNQKSAARGAESLGDGSPLYNAIVMLDAETARSAFTQIGGEVHASTYGVLVDNSRFVRDAIGERLRAASDGQAGKGMTVLGVDGNGAKPANATTDLFAVWGKSFGSWADKDGDGNAADLTSNTGGMTVGADANIGENWRFGLLAGYSQTSITVDDRASSGDSDNFDLGFYAGTNMGPLGLRFGATHTWHSIETSRAVSFASFNERLESDYNAATSQVFGEASYRFDMARGVVEPFANLAYVHFSNDAFRELGGASALDSDEGEFDTLFTTLGVRASTSFDIDGTATTLHGSLGWQHAAGDDPELSLAFSGGDAFTIRGAPIAEDAAIVRAGLDFAVTPNATLGIGYSGQLGSSVSSNGVTGNMSIKF